MNVPRWFEVGVTAAVFAGGMLTVFAVFETIATIFQ